jgi:rod shape determining protein RodA
MLRHFSLRDLDWPLLGVVVLLSSLGVLQIFSATHDTVWRDAWWKQLLWLALGLVVLWVATTVDYHAMLHHVPLIYLASIATLLAVFFVGKLVFGSRRWIPIGGFNFQVSEFVKLVIILLVARYLTEVRGEILEGWELVKLSGLVAVPMVLVMLQPDLGTALTYLPILGAGCFLAGLRWKYVAAVGVLLAVLLPVGWYSNALWDYQKGRVETFLNPDSDPRGRGYQAIQSKIAVGAGGMWGKGVTRGTQTQLRFLPVPHTDFIFSAFAEEHGFAGVVFVLILYFVLLMQIVQNAQTAADRAGVYLCMGVAALLLFHVLVNVGMVVGRMPVAGIPLPLLSYGGSNLLSTFLMLGLVNNVRLRRFVN